METIVNTRKATWFIDTTQNLASPAIYLAALGAVSFYATIKLKPS